MHNDKFNSEYINFINQNFNPNDHLFIFIADAVGDLFPIPQLPNVIKLFCSRRHFYRYLLLAYYCIQADKIILHGLFINYIIRFLYINRYLLKKCYWVIWGGDLYIDIYKQHISDRQSQMSNYVKKHIFAYITYTTGDFNLAKQQYASNPLHFKCLNYLSNLIKPKTYVISRNKKITKILVGNSATETNHHQEIFEKLLTLPLDNLQIICPLSYGNPQYREMVIALGKKYFQHKFFAITDLLPLNEYLNLLSTIDIALFHHKRQQAMGNIMTLLSYGKKIYMTQNTLYDELIAHGFVIYNIQDKINLNLLTKAEIDKHTNIIEQSFQHNNLILQLNELFNYEIPQ